MRTSCTRSKGVRASYNRVSRRCCVSLFLLEFTKRSQPTSSADMNYKKKFNGIRSATSCIRKLCRNLVAERLAVSSALNESPLYVGAFGDIKFAFQGAEWDTFVLRSLFWEPGVLPNSCLRRHYNETVSGASAVSLKMPHRRPKLNRCRRVFSKTAWASSCTRDKAECVVMSLV